MDFVPSRLYKLLTSPPLLGSAIRLQLLQEAIERGRLLEPPDVLLRSQTAPCPLLCRKHELEEEPEGLIAVLVDEELLGLVLGVSAVVDTSTAGPGLARVLVAVEEGVGLGGVFLGRRSAGWDGLVVGLAESLGSADHQLVVSTSVQLLDAVDLRAAIQRPENLCSHAREAPPICSLRHQKLQLLLHLTNTSTPTSTLTYIHHQLPSPSS